jgi:acyl-CoA thioester hydrolase
MGASPSEARIGECAYSARMSRHDDAPPVPAHAFSLERVPQSTDIDELEHVSNVVYVRWIQEVAIEHSRAAGYDSDAYHELGAVFVVRRHEVDYLAPAYAGERVRITTWVDSWRGASALRRTVIERAEGDAVARALTLWVFIDRRSGRPVRIPPELVEAFGG